MFQHVQHQTLLARPRLVQHLHFELLCVKDKSAKEERGQNKSKPLNVYVVGIVVVIIVVVLLLLSSY